MTAHDPTSHPRVMIRWSTDLTPYGIARAPSMRDVGYLLRALDEGCQGCIRHWARRVLQGDPLVVAHLVCVSWSFCVAAHLDTKAIFGAESWSIIFRYDVAMMPELVALVDSLSTSERASALDNALFAWQTTNRQ